MQLKGIRSRTGYCAERSLFGELSLHSLSTQQPINWRATTIDRLNKALPVGWMVKGSTLMHEWDEGEVPKYRLKGYMKHFSMSEYIVELKPNERVFANVNPQWLSWKAVEAFRAASEQERRAKNNKGEVNADGKFPRVVKCKEHRQKIA